MSDQEKTSGVQELIDRLSQDGVAAGHRQAENIVADAQAKAEDILESARRQASEIVKQAQAEAVQLKSASEEALRLAARDTVRDFDARIHTGFKNRLQGLLRHDLQDPQLLKSMILEITRQATEGLGDGPVEILIPREVISEQEMRTQIEKGNLDALTKFVQGIVGENLREGFTVGLGSQTHGGLTVRMVEDNLEVDLSEEAIAEFLSLHLLPRFRAMMNKSSVGTP